MLNLKTAKGQKLLAAGTWVWTLFTINFAWFLINFSVILTLIILASFPNGIFFYAINVVLACMLSVFTVPSLTACFKATKQWQLNGSTSYFKPFFKNWLEMQTHWQANWTFGLVGGLFILFNRLAFGQPLLHMFVITSTLIYLIVLIADCFQTGTQQVTSTVALLIAKPGRMLVAALLFLILILMNFILQLAFLIVICSISLATLGAYKLLGGTTRSEN